MNKSSIFYCRLEGFHNLIFKGQPDAIWEKSIFLKHNVYACNINDIKYLKLKIKQATELWNKKNPEQERYLTYEQWKENKIDILYDEKRDRYPGFLIFNQQQDWKMIGFCYQGWFTLGNSFSKYLNKYIFDSYGKDDFHKCLKRIKGKKFLFLVPAVHGVHERELLSNELIDIELKHFLDGEEITEEIKQEVYYPEIVRRGYIDILNEI